MHTIQQTLRNAAINGVINIDKAIAALAPFDNERAQTVDLLKACEKEVGMYRGEAINAHLATMTGGYFNERDYHFERLPGEQ